MLKPLCFVLMPFGKKPDAIGRTIDFDVIYKDLIAPAVQAAGLEVIRADEEQVGGSIHKPMYERLMLCEYAIADVTGANANVYYELGIRHALRPRSTVIIFAEGTLLPFDVAPLRGIPYQMDAEGRLTDAPGGSAAIVKRLLLLHGEHTDDSPVYQLIEGMPRYEVDHEKTDTFRGRAAYSKTFKDRLAIARLQGAEAVRAVAADPELADLPNVEAGILVDLFLSFRDAKLFEDMVALYARMSKPVQRARMVQEQYGFALNRLGRSDEAERVLKAIIADFGPNSETNGLLGRVYKDRWESAVKAGEVIRARGALDKAIDAYLAGFQADWRDAYPGINALTLMELSEKPDSRQSEIAPVVLYAASRKARSSSANYWDHATLLEIAVLARNEDAAMRACETALATLELGWWGETTLRNLNLIYEKRAKRGEDVAWIEVIQQALEQAVAGMQR